MGYLLEELTWPKAQKALAETKFAIIPTGSIEQHGPHMPVGTDYLIAQELAKRVGEISPVVVTPAIPIGYADYHADFPGTLSLSEETLSRVYYETCSYLIEYGVTHILFINGHGGNLGPLTTVGNKLRKENILAATIMWWETAQSIDPSWSLIGHGDFLETSVMLAIAEKIVDLGEAKLPVRQNLSDSLVLDDIHECRFKSGLVHVSLRTHDYSATGDMIEYGVSPNVDHSVPPSTATAKLGKEILDKVAVYIKEFIEEFKEVRLPVGR